MHPVAGSDTPGPRTTGPLLLPQKKEMVEVWRCTLALALNEAEGVFTRSAGTNLGASDPNGTRDGIPRIPRADAANGGTHGMPSKPCSSLSRNRGRGWSRGWGCGGSRDWSARGGHAGCDLHREV